MKLKALIAGILAVGLMTPALADGPKSSWTGFYIGAQAGLDMGEVDFGAPVSITERGIGYGAAVGFDWQMPGSPIVLGVAADHMWTDAMAIEKHWSVTGRGGIVIGNAMPYVLAGYKRADVLGTDLDGWVVGGGMEFALGRGLYVGGEYRLTTFDLPSWVPAGIEGMQHEVRATLKYKFGGLF